MVNHKNNILLTIISWHFIVLTIILYLSIIIFIGYDIITIGILTILWYPYLSYYLTIVSFYDNHIRIIRPLLIFYSKDILYKNIDLMNLTQGKGTMVKIYLKKKENTYTFSPPLFKSKHKKMLALLETNDIKYHF